MQQPIYSLVIDKTVGSGNFVLLGALSLLMPNGGSFWQISWVLEDVSTDILFEIHSHDLSTLWYWGSDLEPGMIYFPTKWGAKEPQNPQNHRVVIDYFICFFSRKLFVFHSFLQAFALV